MNRLFSVVCVSALSSVQFFDDVDWLTEGHVTLKNVLLKSGFFSETKTDLESL